MTNLTFKVELEK